MYGLKMFKTGNVWTGKGWNVLVSWVEVSWA